MSTNGSLAKVALPYAEALFESSQVMQLTSSTCQDLDIISKTIKQSNILESFLSNPLVINDAKKKVLHDLFINKINNHVLNFLSILVERRRITLLGSIIDCYLSLVYQLQLITVVNVYTAIMLTEVQKESLKDKLQRMTSSKEIQLIEHINPDLIGGFVIKIGSKVIDMSIYGQLNQISSYLNSARL